MIQGQCWRFMEINVHHTQNHCVLLLLDTRLTLSLGYNFTHHTHTHHCLDTTVWIHLHIPGLISDSNYAVYKTTGTILVTVANCFGYCGVSKKGEIQMEYRQKCDEENWTCDEENWGVTKQYHWSTYTQCVCVGLCVYTSGGPTHNIYGSSQPVTPSLTHIMAGWPPFTGTHRHTTYESNQPALDIWTQSLAAGDNSHTKHMAFWIFKTQWKVISMSLSYIWSGGWLNSGRRSLEHTDIQHMNQISLH